MPTFSRAALHALVWAEPLTKITARLGLHAGALSRACHAADVPLPAAGHWTRLAMGRPTTTPELPPRGPAMAHQVTLEDHRLPYGERDRLELAQPDPEPPVFDEPIAAVRARTVARLGRVRALPTLDRAHPAVRAVLADDRRRAAEAKARRGPTGSDGVRFETPFERRRLRLLNSLGFGLARVGATLQLGGESAREVEVTVGSQRLGLHLDALGARLGALDEDPRRPDAAGRLVLHLTGRHEAEALSASWSDTDEAPLESRLAEIVVDLLMEAEARHRAAAIDGHARRLAWRARLAAERRERQADAVRRQEERDTMRLEARRARLQDQAQDWRAARDIRGFVAEVAAEVGARRRAPRGFGDWWAWALAEADALDPALGGFEPWRPQDDERFERPCGCGARCERSCGCGLTSACLCDCPGEEPEDTHDWLRFPEP